MGTGTIICVIFYCLIPLFGIISVDEINLYVINQVWVPFRIPGYKLVNLNFYSMKL